MASSQFKGNEKAIQKLFADIRDETLSSDERLKRVKSAINLLLSAEISIDVTDEKGTTPLLLATSAGYTEVVSALLEAKADPNKADEKRNETSLRLAAESGYATIVSSLLNAKADPKKAVNCMWWTPLINASEKGYAKIVSALLDAKADPNETHKMLSVTPLICAAQQKYVGYNTWLSTYINTQSDQNPARASQDYTTIVLALLESKADPNKTNYNGLTPLSYAAQSYYSEMVTILLAAKADPNVRGTRWNENVLNHAIREGNTKLLTALLEAKADPETAENGKSLSPLSYAVELNEIGSLNALLHAKADPNPNKSDEKAGVSPLTLAVRYSRSIMVSALLEAKADPNKTAGRSKETPLGLAASRDNSIIVSALLNAKADVNKKCSRRGETPLMLAAYNNHPENIKILLEAKADINRQCHIGNNALDYAIKSQVLASTALLLREGSEILDHDVLREFLSSKDQWKFSSSVDQKNIHLFECLNELQLRQQKTISAEPIFEKKDEDIPVIEAKTTIINYSLNYKLIDQRKINIGAGRIWIIPLRDNRILIEKSQGGLSEIQFYIMDTETDEILMSIPNKLYIESETLTEAKEPIEKSYYRLNWESCAELPDGQVACSYELHCDTFPRESKAVICDYKTKKVFLLDEMGFHKIVTGNNSQFLTVNSRIIKLYETNSKNSTAIPSCIGTIFREEGKLFIDAALISSSEIAVLFYDHRNKNETGYSIAIYNRAPNENEFKHNYFLQECMDLDFRDARKHSVLIINRKLNQLLLICYPKNSKNEACLAIDAFDLNVKGQCRYKRYIIQEKTEDEFCIDTRTKFIELPDKNTILFAKFYETKFIAFNLETNEIHKIENDLSIDFGSCTRLLSNGKIINWIDQGNRTISNEYRLFNVSVNSLSKKIKEVMDELIGTASVSSQFPQEAAEIISQYAGYSRDSENRNQPKLPENTKLQFFKNKPINTSIEKGDSKKSTPKEKSIQRSPESENYNHQRCILM